MEQLFQRIVFVASLFCLISGLFVNSAELEDWSGAIISGSFEFKRGSYGITKKSQISQKLLNDTFEVRFNPETTDTSKFQRITLTDGSKLTGTVGISNNFEEVPFTLANGKVLTLKGEIIQNIEFAHLDAGAKIIGKPPGPHCISRNGKTILCNIEWVSYNDISIKTKAGRIKLDRTKIHLLGFARKQISPISKSNVRLRTRFNDSIIGRLVIADSQTTQLDHITGRMTFKTSDLLSIETLSENVKSLVDLDPLEVKHTAYMDYIKKSQINKNLFGGSLTLSGIRFDQGIAMHSKCSMSFMLNGAYKRLVTNIGLDTSITDQGNAEFVIIGNDRELKRIPVTGKDKTKILHVDVSGVKKLIFLLDYGKNGSSGDHAVWGNPRLVK